MPGERRTQHWPDRHWAAFSRPRVADNGRCVFKPVGPAFFFVRPLGAAATILFADGGRDQPFISCALSLAGRGFARRHRDIRPSVLRVMGSMIGPLIIWSRQRSTGGLSRPLDKALPIPQRYYAVFASRDHLALCERH